VESPYDRPDTFGAVLAEYKSGQGVSGDIVISERGSP
jgi:hypothetical protein